MVPGFGYIPPVVELPLCHVNPGAPDTSVYPRAVALPSPVTDADFHDGGRPDYHKVTLGRFLFFDKELSGNRNISCATCHSGKFQTNHDFHAIAIPQIGPGKEDGYLGLDDFGRERVTGNRGDRYKFRTPTLRNVAVTGPWGHDGAYATLEGIVRHHADPVGMLSRYNTSQVVLPKRADLEATDFAVHRHGPSRAALAGANELRPVTLSDEDVRDLVAFLGSLTDPAALDLSSEIPTSVPSGLPVTDYLKFREPVGSRQVIPMPFTLEEGNQSRGQIFRRAAFRR